MCDLVCSWLLRGFRYGEALHPGPSVSVTLAVVNPTTILHKTPELMELGADILVLSETAATRAVQHSVSRELRQRKFVAWWGSPCPDRVNVDTGRPGLRGAALGTAVITSLPSRGPLNSFPDYMSSSCRINECFVRVGDLELRIIALYGFPRCLPDASVKNNELLAWAYTRMCATKVPTLVAGDLNTPVAELPAWAAFEGLGWRELGDHMSSAHGVELPCTCKSSTRHDTFLVPPALLQFCTGADVWEPVLFDSHKPMRMHLQLPGNRPAPYMWRLPQCWSAFVPDKTALQQPYQARASSHADALRSSELSLAERLHLWSEVVESAVSDVMHDAAARAPDAGLPRSLPKSFRGRCKARPRIQGAWPTLPRQAPHGDPQPVCETTSVIARQKLRQARRLTTIACGLRKLPSLTGRAFDTLQDSLHKEWNAILRAPGYRGSFAAWLAAWPCVGVCPLTLPSLGFVVSAAQLVQFDYQAVARQEAATRRDGFRYKMFLDHRDKGCQAAFAQVRPPQHAPFCKVEHLVQSHATQLEAVTFSCRRFQVPCPTSFLLHSGVLYARLPAEVTGRTVDTLTLQFESKDDLVLPGSGPVCQIQEDCTPEGVTNALLTHWQPIWNRDSPAAECDIEQWPRFQEILEGRCRPFTPAPIDMLCQQPWVHVCASLKVASAKGVCGWANAELRLLPPAALCDLAAVLSEEIADSWPAHLLQGKVAVVSKVAEPRVAADARPITVLSCLYRLWGRVFVTQTLDHWSQSMPPPFMMGFVKGRSALDLSVCVSHSIEEALCSGDELSKVTLDLKRAFNTFPRRPIRELLVFLGLPPKLVGFWIQGLSVVSRHFDLQGSLSPGLGSTNGLCEGDPVSILGMLALCWLFVEVTSEFASPNCYVDNWAWQCDLLDSHVPTMFAGGLEEDVLLGYHSQGKVLVDPLLASLPSCRGPC